MAESTVQSVLLVLATSTGGVGAHVRSVEEQLRARGVRVTVACPASTQEAFAFATWAPVEIGSRPAPRDLRAIRALRVLASGHDVVHAHGLRSGALVPRGAVVTWHNAQLGGGLGGAVGSALERWTARRAAVTLVVSPDLGARARALGGRDVRAALVAAPPRRTVGHDPGLGHPLVLAVGRLHPQKGFGTLVDALPSLGDITVAVAGDGPLREELQRRAPQVQWLGRREDVADLLAAADVVVLPSVWEGRSLLVQEALSAGRPLVTTAVGGTPDLVGDGAVLVPAGDPHALAAAVRALLDDPVAAAELGARGRDVAASWPDEAAVAAHLLEVYSAIGGST